VLTRARATPWEINTAELTRQVLDYARGLGLDTISCGGGFGEVPDAFRAQYPDARYLEMNWEGWTQKHYLDPSDPLFRKLQVAFLRAFNARYGTCHIYNYDPYPEMAARVSDEEKVQLKYAFARAISGIIREADPEGQWYLSGWAFTYPDWPPETVKAFLDLIPNDRFYLADVWAEVPPAEDRSWALRAPVYVPNEHFYGKNWLFGILHTFGKRKLLYGDAAELIQRLQEGARSEAWSRCRGIYTNPESICHNIFYFTLASDLGWDPGRVALESFTDAYTRTRYGEAAYPAMRQALDRIVRATQGADTVRMIACYWTRPFEYVRFLSGPEHQREAAARGERIAQIREAIDLALTARAVEEGNPLYENDLVAWYRQLMSEIYNREIHAAYEAFCAGDTAGLDMAADKALAAMRSIEDVLAHAPDYRMSDIVAQARRLPGSDSAPANFPDAPSDLDLVGVIKADHTYLNDYAATDLWELLALYYRPRVEAYVRTLETRLRRGKTAVSQTELAAAYDRLRAQWMAAHLAGPPEQRPVLDIIQQHLRGMAEEEDSS